MLEHIICKHIRNHLEQNNILTPVQHGFRRGHSTESQLLITLHDLTSRWDKRTQTDMVILDFSKAFDVVPHEKLLDKLTYYGIQGNVHKWISHFLKQRHQCVVVDGTKSERVHVDSGVPQGTVMGPLLFLLYINDLPSVVSSQVRLFADDCLLYRTVKSSADQVALQKDLEALSVWAKKWGMSFNPSKCFIMSISPKKDKLDHLYSLLGVVLAKVPHSVYLGVTIRDDLQWESHIQGITSKAARTLGFLRRNLQSCPPQLRNLAYFALVRSKVEYAASVWDPYLTKDINKIEDIQRRAARFVCNDHRQQSSVTEMLAKLEWTSLKERREKSRLSLLNKIVHAKVAIPLDQYLQKSNSRTRAVNSHKFNVFSPKTEVFRNSFFPRTVKIWNTTPDSIISALETTEGTVSHD